MFPIRNFAEAAGTLAGVCCRRRVFLPRQNLLLLYLLPGGLHQGQWTRWTQGWSVFEVQLEQSCLRLDAYSHAEGLQIYSPHHRHVNYEHE